MGYDFGRYTPPPAAPALPADLRTRVPLPGPGDHGFALHLPPPPAEAERTAGLDVVHELAASRTPDGVAWANYMDHKGATSMWWHAGAEMRQDLGPVKGSLATGVLVATQAAGLLASYLPGQGKYDRDRPFEVDPDLTTVGQRPTNSSYPSGHTRQAFAMARVVSALDPRRTDEVYGLANQLADSRMYAGMHFPADVQAGARLGTAVGDAMVGAALAPRRAADAFASATSTAAAQARQAASDAARGALGDLWRRLPSAHPGEG